MSNLTIFIIAAFSTIIIAIICETIKEVKDNKNYAEDFIEEYIDNIYEEVLEEIKKEKENK